jgi:uncharacterized protein
MSGRFVWYELMTSDTKGAIAFYSEVIGYKTQLFPDGQAGKEPYTMWVGSQGPMGGVMTLPEEAKQMGAPPHWMAHVEVDDVDATVAKVKDKGGKVYVPPTDIPTVGRFSVIADPQGASLSVFKSSQAMQPHDTTKQGEISWNELVTTDAAAAWGFYSDLFGWKQISEMDMGPAGKYLIYGQGEKQYGGIMNKTPDMPMPPSWTYYIQVDDLASAMARATSMGAKLVFGPQEVPGGTSVAQLFDPQGAHFALHGPG